jgi:hypothetical protein
VLGIEAVPSARIKAMPFTLGERAVCFHGVIDGETMLLNPWKLFSVPSFYSAF